MPDFEGKPIRKRGYHRAVKRGDKWAVELSKMTGFTFLCSFAFRNVDIGSMMKAELKKDSWLLKSIPKDDAWKGGYIEVPFKYAKKDDE